MTPAKSTRDVSMPSLGGRNFGTESKLLAKKPDVMIDFSKVQHGELVIKDD